MSNIINLVSESVFSEKMDIQNAFLAAIAANSGSPSVNSWADVQALVRAGLADKVFSVGDRLVCERNGSEIVWDIIGIDCDTPTDKGFTHSLTLQMHTVFASRVFDADADNNWKNSDLRVWLNNAQNGFAAGLDSDFTAVLGQVDKITAVPAADGSGTMTGEVTTELFFIPSKTEIFGIENFGVAEGVPYPFFNGNNSRLKYRDNAELISYYYTRSVGCAYGSSNPSGNRIVLVNGKTGTEYVAAVPGAYGAAPTCCVV